MNSIHVLGLFVGKPVDSDFHESKTSIYRNEVESIIVNKDSIENDLCGDLRFHGGLDRVLHQYCSENYSHWKKHYNDDRLTLGSFGENLCSTIMNESNVCIGDVYQIGDVEAIVSEPRKPCATINQKFQINTMVKDIIDSAKTGWFYKIQKAGVIKKNDQIILLNRTSPELTIEKCVHALYKGSDKEVLKLMVNNPDLSNNWKNQIERKLNGQH